MPIYKCENTTRLFRENKEQDVIKFLRPELNSSYKFWLILVISNKHQHNGSDTTHTGNNEQPD